MKRQFSKYTVTTRFRTKLAADKRSSSAARVKKQNYFPSDIIYSCFATIQSDEFSIDRNPCKSLGITSVYLKSDSLIRNDVCSSRDALSKRVQTGFQSNVYQRSRENSGLETIKLENVRTYLHLAATFPFEWTWGRVVSRPAHPCSPDSVPFPWPSIWLDELRLKNGVKNSTGNGKMMVEFFSADMLLNVCRYLSCVVEYTYTHIYIYM